MINIILLKEFIDTILNKKDRWRGTFYIFIGYENINEFGEPKYKYKCEYEYYGKLTGNLPPDDILNKKVESITAYGGWSLMDYHIQTL